MKKSDTEQEQPGLEENKVPDSQSKRELDRELQELAEKEHQEEIYYEERRRERHERNLKRKKYKPTSNPMRITRITRRTIVTGCILILLLYYKVS